MRRRHLLDALAAAAAGTVLPGAAWARKPQPAQAEVRRLQAHLRFLADPLLQGREAGTRGFELAARYVAGQFAQMGLKPLGEAGGYALPVALKTARLAPTAPTLEICRGQACERLAYLDEFATRPDLSTPRSEVQAPLAFVGYGIEAPRFGLDDYAGLDVKGCIVVVLSGRPPQLPTEEGAHFGNGRTKAELAVSRGAVGLISLATPRSEIAAPFHASRQYADSLSMDWRRPDGRGGSEIAGLQAFATVSLQAAPRLMAALAPDFTALVADAEAGRPLPRGALGLSARLVRDSVLGEALSHNVVGLIEGRHPRRRHEVLLLTAHLDHLGHKTGPQGEIVYPGAMDNAIGMATLLEATRVLAAGPAPERSILVAALTAEEKGSLGSACLAAHPPLPAETLVADVNIDMPILLHDFREVVALGAEHSSLGQAVAVAARRLGLAVVDDPMPEQSRFTRSDQYSFVRRGIPALILGPGGASFDPREDGNALMRDFRRQRYHQPGDDLAQPFHWRAAQRFAQLHVELLRQLSHEPHRPRWNPGDFFGELYAARR